MANPPGDSKTGSGRRRAALFVFHQAIGTIGIIAGAPVVIALSAPVFRLLGWATLAMRAHTILTQTPYFPLQIALGLLAGWVLGRYLFHPLSPWVWLAPCVILCFALVAFPETGQFAVSQYAYLSSPSVLSHFFGRGCRPADRCLDQLVITLPFYSAAAYSLGALLARKGARAP